MNLCMYRQSPIFSSVTKKEGVNFINFASEFHRALLMVLDKIRAFNIEILLMLIGHIIL